MICTYLDITSNSYRDLKHRAYLLYMALSLSNFGMSGRCSSRSAFGRSTGIDVSGHYKRDFWHKRAAFQQSAFGRSTAGNDVVATIIISLFSFFSLFFSFIPVFPPLFFSSVATFSHRRSARIKKLI